MSFQKLMFLFNKKLDKDIYAACIRYTPDEYTKASLITSIVLSLIVPITLAIFTRNTLLALLSMPITFVTLLFLLSYLPKFVIKFRASDIDTELPFFLSYLSTLSLILPPLDAFNRVLKVPDFIFRETKKETKRFAVETYLLNKDPLDALSEVASTTPHKELRSILEGYVTAVRTGSNPTEYLVNQAEIYLKKRVAEIRVKVESLVSLMEAFVSVIIFAIVTLFSLSISSEALPSLSGFQMMPILRVPRQFIALSYALPLLLALLFLILAKFVQPRYPIADYRQYKYIIIIHIVGIVLILQLYQMQFSSWIDKIFIIDVVLLAMSVLSAIFDIKHQRFYDSIMTGFRAFIKDLVELRRAGVSPEEAISTLENRNYGKFTKYVKLLNEYLRHFKSLRDYIKEVVKEVRNYIVIPLLFIFVDTIDVGGTTVEVFQRFSMFMDSLYLIEIEKKTRLKILKILPFVAALIQFLTITATLIIFDTLVTTLGQPPITDRIGLTIYILLTVSNYVYGLVMGLLSDERLSAGFKYSAILTLISMVFVVFGRVFTGILLRALGVSNA